MRGASTQMDEFIQKGLSTALRREIDDGSVLIVFAAASEALLYLPPDLAKADDVVERVEIGLVKGLEFATCSSAIVRFNETMTLACALRELETDLRLNQLRRPTLIPPHITDGTGGRKECELDGVRPVEVTEDFMSADDKKKTGAKKKTKWQLSHHTRDRLRGGRRLRTGLIGRVMEDDTSPDQHEASQWPRSFDDFGSYQKGIDRFPEQIINKMCVMVVDGNKFNNARSNLGSLRAISEFSSIVSEATKAALRYALAPLWRTAKARHEDRTLPFHILMLAGDEFALALPAAWAIDVISDLPDAFSTIAAEMILKSPSSPW
jgi:hypothetical protein